jgi:hypothetical protein
MATIAAVATGITAHLEFMPFIAFPLDFACASRDCTGRAMGDPTENNGLMRVEGSRNACQG